MATIKFLIQKENDNANIYVRFINGRTFDIKAKTGYTINAELWNKETGNPRTGFKDADKKEKCNDTQSDLTKLKAKIDKAYNDATNKAVIDAQWLKDIINPPIKINAVSDKLIEFIDYYNELQTNKVKSGTLKRNKATRNLIENFMNYTKSVFLIKDVEPNFIEKFEKYCLNEKYSLNYIARAVTYFKTICFNAKLNDIETSIKLELIKTTKAEKVDKIYLTPEELIKIENKIFDTDYLDNARDWLLISCETGQRVSDFLRFTKEMVRVKKDKTGKTKTLISFIQVKTEKKMDIPLSNKVLKILNKRHGQFPRQITDQKYNEYIKDVCKIAEVKAKTKGSKAKTDDKVTRKVNGTFEKWELVTSHIGRRSFATNNYGKIPTSVLIYITGHSTESMFLEYIGKSDEDKAMQASEYF
jgi:integrase